jgi:uncharacterized protein involved in exopolysaccharide biosynthesis
MSRIDDALRRITGAKAEPRPASGLERYASEPGYRPEESNSSPFVATDPLPVERRPSVSQNAAAPTVRAIVPTQTVPAITPAQSEPNPEAEPHKDPEKLLDLRPIADYLGFLGGSLRRHKILAATTFLLAFALTAAIAMLLPKTYHVQTRLLAQRNEVMSALSNPGRAVPWDADAPTKAAAETILRRDNLISLIRQTDLLNEWERTRIPVLKFKDWLKSFMGRRATPDEKLEALVGLLEARMYVVASPVGDGTVTIDLDWPNAEMAYRLVAAAQQAFIDARQVAERAAINESIAILERYSTTLHENINNTLAELQRTQPQGRSAGGTARTAVVSAPVTPPLTTASVTAILPPVPDAALGVPALGADLDDPEIPRLKNALTSKRQEIASLEDQRRHQLSDLQAQLTRLTTIYTPAHPMVQGAQQNIAALSRDSPQLAALKTETDRMDSEYQKRVAAVAELQQVEQLKTEFANRGHSADAAAQAPRAAVAKAAPTAPPEKSNAPGGNDPTDFASIQLRLELNQLESVLERTDGARIELAVSDAAFKYRYSVIRPPQVPRDPIRPNLRMIVIAGFFGSLLLGFAAAVGKDLLSDRIFERWQIERHLGLPILGSLGPA